MLERRDILRRKCASKRTKAKRVKNGKIASLVSYNPVHSFRHELTRKKKRRETGTVRGVTGTFEVLWSVRQEPLTERGTRAALRHRAAPGADVYTFLHDSFQWQDTKKRVHLGRLSTGKILEGYGNNVRSLLQSRSGSHKSGQIKDARVTLPSSSSSVRYFRRIR